MQLFWDEGKLKQKQQTIHVADERFVEESLFVEKIYIKKSNPIFNQLTELSFASKNLYNTALYQFKQNYFEYKKIIQPITDRYNELIKQKQNQLAKQLSLLEENIVVAKGKDKENLANQIYFLKKLYTKEFEQLKTQRQIEYQHKLKEVNFEFANYYSINKMFVEKQQPDYYCEKLNVHTSQQILRIVQQNINSYLALIKKKQEQGYDKNISLPKYLKKEDGLFVVPYSNQRLIKSSFIKENVIHLSGTSIKLTHKKFNSLEKFNCIKQVRIVPFADTIEKNRKFTIEIVRSLFPDEKNIVLNRIYDKNSDKVMVRHTINKPKLDEKGNLIFKTKIVTKRGVKKKDEFGKLIVEQSSITEQVFDVSTEYCLFLNQANLAGLDVNLNQLAVACFNQNKQDESFLIPLKELKSINWEYNKKKARLQSILNELNLKLTQCELIQKGQFTFATNLQLIEKEKIIHPSTKICHIYEEYKQPYSCCLGFMFLTETTQKEIIDQLIIDKKRIKNKIKKLTTFRNKQMEIALHKISKKLIDQLNLLSINALIIGKNKEWKQEINLGKSNNQNFVMLPFAQLLDKILYKANKSGIHVIFTEESYTSKISFFDKETLLNFYDSESIKEKKKQEGFIGNRIKRGLFKSPNRKQLFHADINGAFNIMRKVTGDLIYNYVSLTSLGGSHAVKKLKFTLFH